MKKYRKTGNGLSSQALQLKKRIARNRRRAIFVGLTYLLGVLALTAAVALVPMFKDGGAYTALKFYEAFLSIDTSSAAGLIKLGTAVLYTIVLLVAVISVIKSFARLGWLFKKSANNEYGFNRNVYAMADIGSAFSATLITIMLNYFLIALCDNTLVFEMLFAIVLGVGVVLHLLCGVWGAKACYYDIHEGQLLEQARIVGRGAPFLRNFLQIAVSVVMMHFLLKANATMAIVSSVLGAGTTNMVSCILLALVVVCLIPLIKHAIDNTEYNMDGYEGAGMKTFRVFTFFVFLLSLAANLYGNLVVKTAFSVDLLIVAIVAFVSFILEILMRKRPRFPDEIAEKKEEGVQDPEMSLDSFTKSYVGSNAVDNVGEERTTKGVTTYAFNGQNQAVANGSNTVITYPQPQPYPMPYPVPYPQQPMHPTQPQQPLMPYPGFMMGNGAGVLPVMAGMAMLPSVMNGLGIGQQQPMNMQVQNTNLLPSQMMEEALRNKSARTAAKKILLSEGLQPPVKSRKQRRKEEKARQKALRKMQRPVMAEESVEVVDPIVADKTFVQEPAVEEKLPAPAVEENAVDNDELDEIASAFSLDDDMSPIKIDVMCPCCKKKLRVTSVAMYNRCPSCKTVFQVRPAQKKN